MKPTLILVGADKGGVGKTTISRALLDYFARKNVLTRAFDTENPRGSLRRFYPTITEVIDLGHVAEGVYCARSVVQRAAGVGVEMPIAQAVVALLDGRIHPAQAVALLMGREPTVELF